MSSTEVTAGFDWDEAMSGDIWRVVRGTDFEGTVSGFRSLLRSKARYHDVKVRVKKDDELPEDAVVFQFYTEEDA
jgi:hypothetical protein